jgi:hypothetical protein
LKVIYLIILFNFFLTCGGFRNQNKLKVNLRTSDNGSNKVINCRDKAQECHKMAMFLDPFFLMGSWMCGQVPDQPSCYDNEK